MRAPPALRGGASGGPPDGAPAFETEANGSADGSGVRVAQHAAADVFVASQWQLIWWKFKEHKLAMVSAAVLGVLYLAAIFAGFLAPYDPSERNPDYVLGPPQRPRFLSPDGIQLRPFVYATEGTVDFENMLRIYTDDTSRRYPVRFFVRSHPYRFWGLFETDRHLFGVEGGEGGGALHLLGTDRLGRDMFSRIIHGARISLSVGLVGVAISLLLGLALGGIAGYFGGGVDAAVQRISELLRSFPVIPLWMALSAALPPDWPPLLVYFGVTVILSLRGWTALGRETRGKILSLKNEDFVLAGRLGGAGTGRVLRVHLIPSFASHIIATLTLEVPGMIIGETSLSFLGLGLRDPVISWGVLMQKAQNIYTIANAPWLLLPGVLVIVAVLCFNFLGDGMRDAADPYAVVKR